MNKLKARLIPLMVSLCIMVCLSSCMMTKTPVGTYQESQGQEYTYAQGKQIWLFWGLLPIGRTHVNTPADGNCAVVTRLDLVDFLISGLTGGIIRTQTIKVKTKRK